VLTETVIGVMLINILSTAAALPLRAAQHSVAENSQTAPSDRKQSSSRERRQGLRLSRHPRRRNQDRTEPHKPKSLADPKRPPASEFQKRA
jgi:hypothetical protein